MSQRTVAIVTGGSGGIGSAICRMFARNGVDVAVHYHQAAKAAYSLSDELSTTGVAVRAVQADLTVESQVQNMVSRVKQDFGQIDYLVNNAGWTRVVPEGSLSELDDATVDRILRLKVHAPLYCIRAARQFLAASSVACVVNITSAAGIAARGSNHIYAAANAALSTLTRSLARSLAPAIRVNSVAPGFVNTGFAWPTDGDMTRLVSENNYIGRVVEPDEVAVIVKFLCLDSLTVTGEEVAVDGGIGRLGKAPGK